MGHCEKHGEQEFIVVHEGKAYCSVCAEENVEFAHQESLREVDEGVLRALEHDIVIKIVDVTEPSRQMMCRVHKQTGILFNGSQPYCPKCYEEGKTNVGPHGGSDECDECDGTGIYYIDGVPEPCICSEPQEEKDETPVG